MPLLAVRRSCKKNPFRSWMYFYREATKMDSVLDMHTMWTRINQLEMMVLAQAKEIEHLKRLGQLRSATNNNNNNCPTAHDARPHHSYQMNSFVHPTNAIPPCNSNREPPLQLANGKPIFYHSPARTPPPPAPPSANKRWSAAPNLGSSAHNVINDHHDEDLDDSQELRLEDQQHKKHTRQSFVEQSRPPTRTSDSEEEDIDVERLDLANGSLCQAPCHDDRLTVSNGCQQVQKPNQSVALVERTHQQDHDSDIEELEFIPPKPKVRPPSQIVKFESGVDDSNTRAGNRNPQIRYKHTKAKTPFKTVPKKNHFGRRDSVDPDQSWIWPSRSRQSLPIKLGDAYKQPFPL